MKKYITLAVMLCMALMTIQAQQATFMGLPIEGPITSFNSKLESKGFVLDTSDPECNIYTGTFTGEPVNIIVMPGYENKVAMVGVYLPIENTWDKIVKVFDKYVTLYTNKYGEADIVTREYNGMTPGSKAFHDALIDASAEYRNIFIVDNIFITIGIHEAVMSESTDGYQLLILYINDNNFIDDEDYSDEI